MNIKKYNKIFSLLMLLLLFFRTGFAQDTGYPEASKELIRIELEERMEEKLRSRITALLQDENVVVVIKLRLIGEKVTVDIEEEAGGGFALPGVPVEKKLMDEREAKERERLKTATVDKIANIYAWIFVSKQVSKNILDRVKELSAESLGIDTTRGDVLSIETYDRTTTIWSSIENKMDIIKGGVLVLITLGGIMFLLAGIFFLFGPLRKFFENLVKNLAALKMQPEMSAGGIGNPGALSGNTQAAGTQKSGAGATSGNEESVMFSYINEDNIEDISYILSTGPTPEAVMVLNNIPEVLAAKALSKLPVEKQREVINQLKETEFMEPETVKSLNKKIKTKIENIYGGTKRIGRLMQGVEESTRENIINWLKEDNAALAREIESNVVEFKDIINYDEQSFRKIFREAGHQLFAQALRTADEEVIKLVMSKLTKEIAELLKEHIDVAPFNKKRAEEAKFMLAEIVNRLINDGFIEPMAKEEG